MWGNIVERVGLQMNTWCMRITNWILRLQNHTQIT